LVAEGAGDKTLAGAGRAEDQNVVVLVQPAAAGEGMDQAAIETPLGAVIDILETAKANRSSSRKPIPRSRSVGRAAIASRDQRSFTRINTGRVATILGYPTDKLSQIA
jgi:hypothetical protein